MNEILFILEIVIVFSACVFMYKKFGHNGLYTWVSVVTILANLQVSKTISLFGMDVTLGNVLFASTFLATDIISEKYGEEASKKAINNSMIMLVIYVIVTQVTIAYIPLEGDLVSKAMKELFALSPRVCASSMIMYYLANRADIYLYGKLKKKETKMWIRNNASTIICNCLENFGFTFLAFYGIFGIETLISISLTTCIVETVIALLDTPFLYYAVRSD